MTKTKHETVDTAGMASWTAALDYTVDAWQRGVLFLARGLAPGTRGASTAAGGQASGR